MHSIMASSPKISYASIVLKTTRLVMSPSLSTLVTAIFMPLPNAFFGPMKSSCASFRKKYSPQHLSGLKNCLYGLIKLGLVAMVLP
jgi:hypothetical protein